MALYNTKELVVREKTSAVKPGEIPVLLTTVSPVPATVPASEWKRLSKFLLDGHWESLS